MEETLDLRELMQALLRRKWIIAAFVVVAIGVAWFATSRMTPIYRAEATMLVQSGGRGADLLFPGLSAAGSNEIQNFIQILQSRSLAEQTAERLGVTFESETDFRQFWQSISVSPVSNTDVIRVSVEDADRNVAAERANAVIETFIEMSRTMNSAEASRAREFIEQQLQVADLQLQQTGNALLEYRESERVLELSEESRIILSQLTTLESQRAELMISRQEAEERLIHATSPTLEQLRVFEYQYEQERAGLESVYGSQSEHSQLQIVRARLAELQAQIEQEKERLTAPLLQELQFLDARIQRLSDEILELEAQLLALPEKQLTLARYELDYRVAEEMYLFLRNRFEESRITEAMQSADVTVIDRSLPPQSPVRPSPKLNMAIGAFLGLFLGVGMAFVLEFLDTSMKSPDEVERKLGIPVLGRIPLTDDR